MSDVTLADIDALIADIGAFGFADLPSDQRRQRTAELLDLAESAIIIMRARLSRQQEWIDAVMRRGVVGYWHHDLKEGFTKHDLIGAQQLIIRPRPLAKE